MKKAVLWEEDQWGIGYIEDDHLGMEGKEGRQGATGVDKNGQIMAV